MHGREENREENEKVVGSTDGVYKGTERDSVRTKTKSQLPTNSIARSLNSVEMERDCE